MRGIRKGFVEDIKWTFRCFDCNGSGEEHDSCDCDELPEGALGEGVRCDWCTYGVGESCSSCSGDGVVSDWKYALKLLIQDLGRKLRKAEKTSIQEFLVRRVADKTITNLYACELIDEFKLNG